MPYRMHVTKERRGSGISAVRVPLFAAPLCKAGTYNHHGVGQLGVRQTVTCAMNVDLQSGIQGGFRFCQKSKAPYV